MSKPDSAVAVNTPCATPTAQRGRKLKNVQFNTSVLVPNDRGTRRDIVVASEEHVLEMLDDRVLWTRKMRQGNFHKIVNLSNCCAWEYAD